MDELAPLDAERKKLEAHIIVAGGEPPQTKFQSWSFCEPPPPQSVTWETFKASYEAHIVKLRGIVANLKSPTAPVVQGKSQSSEPSPKPGAASQFTGATALAMAAPKSNKLKQTGLAR